MASYLSQHVPIELFEYPNWVAYRLEPKPNGKTDKKPINPKSGWPASTADPNTWGTVDQALACAESDLLAGVGFVFTNSPYAGVDLDDCRNGTGKIEPWAQAIIKALDSYCEVSQSGTGVHIITRGSLPDGGRRRGNIEMYDSVRFFAFTGQHLPGTPKTINERAEALEELHRRVFAEPQRPSSVSIPTPSLDDEQIIKQLAGPLYGCPELWRGEVSGYDSPSEADLALCNHLAFWCRGDVDQMDRLFRRSGLFRAKWDEKHFSDGRTYGQATVEKALTETSTGPTVPPSPQTPTITIYWARQALEPQPPIDWVIQDLFSTGSVSLLVGEAGSKKTYAMLDAAVCVALGRLWLGYIATQGHSPSN